MRHSRTTKVFIPRHVATSSSTEGSRLRNSHKRLVAPYIDNLSISKTIFLQIDRTTSQLQQATMHSSMSADEVLAIVGLALAIFLAMAQTWYASREMRTFVRACRRCRLCPGESRSDELIRPIARQPSKGLTRFDSPLPRPSHTPLYPLPRGVLHCHSRP